MSRQHMAVYNDVMLMLRRRALGFFDRDAILLRFGFFTCDSLDAEIVSCTIEGEINVCYRLDILTEYDRDRLVGLVGEICEGLPCSYD